MIARGGLRFRDSAGFSLLEVLIALVVTAVGLLGFALMQTMNLRFTQSANYRTQATNLAYDLLDQVRANRVLLSQFEAITPAGFGSLSQELCAGYASVSGDFVTPAQSMNRWRCQVRAVLGDKATAEVIDLGNGRLRVWVNWADMRSEDVGDDVATRDCAKAASSVCVETQL